MKKIAIIGLGYVGLPLAAEFGKYRKTIGFDIDIKRIKDLKENIDTTKEVLQKDLEKSIKLEFTCDKNHIKDAEIFIVTVPTPVDATNRPELSLIKRATEMIGKILKPGDIVIYESTVFPGCTEEICVPILEELSGLKFNDEFFCGYSPERINPGDKVNTLTKIPKITSGSSPEVSLEINDLYKEIIKAGTFLAKSIKVAEAAKVIENTQRDINIALVNELSIIFNRLEIDTMDVLDAAGSKWNFIPYKPGLVGGHCIGVDPYYLVHKAEQVGYNPQVILSGRRVNDTMSLYMVKKVIQNMILNKIDVTNSIVGILGITFKENCPDIRNSKVIDVISELKKWGVKVIIEDSWADSEALKKSYNIKLGKIKENEVDSLIVAVGHNEYRNMEPKTLRKYCKSPSPVIADVKSLYDREALVKEGFTVFRL